MVVLGGDLVYPGRAATGIGAHPFRAAGRASHPNGHDPALFAIPGNHDWYDGLTNFVRELCQGQRIGGWSMFQRRSYFAVKLMPKWWLWGIDIALDTRIDMLQQAYFLKVLRDSQPGGPERSDEEDVERATTSSCARRSRRGWMPKRIRTPIATSAISFRKSSRRRHRTGSRGDVRVILAGDIP